MFKRWCSEQGFLNHKIQNPSHVLMDGGVLEVPFDRLDDFYKVYIQSIKAGEELFVVEQKTENYKFFLDIDYKNTTELNIDEIKSIGLDVCSKVESLGLPCRCLISVAEPKVVNGVIKTGVHFNWPDMTVSQEGAVHLRWHVISTLNISKTGDWSQYVDGSVYGDLETKTRGSGFRMPWSHKKGKHSDCKGQGCIVCKYSGKLTEGEYLPVFLYDDSGMKPYSPEITLDGMWMATLRTTEDPVEVPKTTIGHSVSKKKEGNFKSLHTKDEIVDNELLALLETFIRLNLPGQSRSRVKKVFKSRNTYRVETTSKYCENLGRNHNSNHIWFYINNDKTICQKCFCRCETMDGRRHGFCRDFSGRAHYMNKRLCEILYPKGKDASTGARNINGFNGKTGKTTTNRKPPRPKA